MAGRLNVYTALTNTRPESDSYDEEGNATDFLPSAEEGEKDIWYGRDEIALKIKRYHYGQGGIHSASGNYSVSCTLRLPFAMGRTYNSRNQRKTVLRRGWTFSFEGSIARKSDSVEVNLPTESSHVFVKKILYDELKSSSKSYYEKKKHILDSLYYGGFSLLKKSLSRLLKTARFLMGNKPKKVLSRDFSMQQGC